MADAMDLIGNPSSVHAEGRAAKMLLAGEVRAIADPHRQRGAAELTADLDHFDVVLDRLRAHRGVAVRQAAELV